jgi:hypothetical protein
VLVTNVLVGLYDPVFVNVIKELGNASYTGESSLDPGGVTPEFEKVYENSVAI